MHRRDRSSEIKRKWITETGVEGLFHNLAKTAIDRWPRSHPPGHLLQSCRIISHRGEHDNHHRFENTLPAFDAAQAAGVWGIELDVRWTLDLVPVVFHDPDTRRLFGIDRRISQIPLDRLKRQFPLIPTLAEVVERYGGRLHLMIEIKSEPYPKPAVQSRRMRDALCGLNPVKEFHLMGLTPGMFNHFSFLPPEAFIPIARLRMKQICRMAAAEGWGGVAGHFLMTTADCVRSQHRRGKAIGTGFVDSAHCLYREAARAVDWAFSNQAANMQAICDQMKDDGQSSSKAACAFPFSSSTK